MKFPRLLNESEIEGKDIYEKKEIWYILKHHNKDKKQINIL